MQSTSTQDTSISRRPLKTNLELTAKDGLFIATECHLASLPDEDGDTPLHLAVVQGDLSACKKYLELFRISGKSIDVYNNLLQTPLHVAIITNKSEIVELLVCCKANPYTPDRYGSTAFHLCAKYNCTECLMKLIENIGDRKLNFNLRDYEGLSPLHVAVVNGSIPTFKVLVEKGADIDAKDNKGGRTPLIYAIEMNRKGIVEMLLEYDASVSQQTYSGDTALHIASGRGLQDIVRLLLRRGADANIKNTHSETPMSLATSPSVSDILKTPFRMSSNSPEERASPAIMNPLYNAYISNNLSLALPMQYSRVMSLPRGDGDNMRNQLSHNIDSRDKIVQWRKRNQHVKKEYHASNSDDEIPCKRHAGIGGILQPVNKRSHPVVVSVSPLATFNTEWRESFTHHIERVTTQEDALSEINDEGDIVPIEEVVMETEVEVSAEEEVSFKSDDIPENANDSSFQVNQITMDDKKEYFVDGAERQEKADGFAAVNVKCESNQSLRREMKMKNQSEKAVIVQKQPQITMATALSKDLRLSYSGIPSCHIVPPSPPIAKESKSVPCSPQPTEANLYQLAREGLAVAAMANSSSSSEILCQNLNVSNYLKSRPSRQAKIKSGTVELQNLALQGLAVAAMNSSNSNLEQQRSRKNSEDKQSDSKSSLTTVPHHLSQVLNPTGSPSQFPPPLFRSHSVPQKMLYNDEPAASNLLPHEEKMNQIISNPLLALAHANARKEKVGQAVSAISMSKSQGPSGSKQKDSFSLLPSEVSENTKLNLRQAIMVKNTGTQLKPTLTKVKVFSPKSNEFKMYDPNLHQFKIYSPSVSPPPQSSLEEQKKINSVSVPTLQGGESPSKFTSTSNGDDVEIRQKSYSGNSKKQTVTTSPNVELALSLRNPSPETSSSVFKSVSTPSLLISKIVNICLPVRGAVEKSSDTEAVQADISQRKWNFVSPNGQSHISMHSFPPLNQKLPESKATKDFTPTNTVAPIQVQANKMLVSPKKCTQSTVVSTNLAPITASRISDGLNSAMFTGSNQSTESSRPVSLPKNITSHSVTTTEDSLPTTTSVISLSKSTSTSMPHFPLVFQSCVAGQTIPSVPGMTLGVPSPLVLNPTLGGPGLELISPPSHAAPYVQHQINYVTFGKDYFPVLMPIGQHPVGTLRSQLPISHYIPLQKPVLDMQATISATENNLQASSSITAASSLTNTFVNNLPGPISSNLLCQMSPQEMLINATRQNGGNLYPVQSPLYPQMQHLDLLQQQYIRSVMLFQQQQTSLLQGKSKMETLAKPTEDVQTSSQTVSADNTTPTIKNQAAEVHSEEQPLNLSKKAGEQPLNLMKTTPNKINNEAQRRSVIKVASSRANDSPVSLVSAIANGATNVGQQLFYQQAALVQPKDQVSGSVMLPPPLAIPGAVPPTSLSGLSLPPIHYVNGMPFVFGFPPSV